MTSDRAGGPAGGHMIAPFTNGDYGPNISVEWGHSTKTAIVKFTDRGASGLVEVTEQGSFSATSEAADYTRRSWVTMEAAIDWLVRVERDWRARCAMIHAIGTRPPRLWVGP